MLLFPSSLQLLQLVDDLHRYLTAEKVFRNRSNYTCKRTVRLLQVSFIDQKSYIGQIMQRTQALNTNWHLL